MGPSRQVWVKVGPPRSREPEPFALNWVTGIGEQSLSYREPMAQKVITQLVDDLDGSELANGEGETVAFGIDGTNYEIDLKSENAEALRSALAEYVGHARKVSGGGRKASRPKSAGDVSSAAEVRAWAESNGHNVPDRGRIPADVRQAYDAAH